jgi:hypothetical protein
LRGFTVGTVDERDFFNYATDMMSGGIVHIEDLMKIGSSIPAVLGANTLTT